MTPESELHGALESLRVDLLCRNNFDASTLAARLRSCIALLIEVDQDEAMAAAKTAALTPSNCLPLLRMAPQLDPDEEHELAAAAADLVTSLSGNGIHTHEFITNTGCLRLRYQPQATGTHGRVWRSERVAAMACESGFGGIRVSEQNVVELACGTGGAGLVCAALGAASVWLTDVDTGGLGLSRSNVILNGALTSKAKVRYLDVHNVNTPDPMDPSPSDDAKPSTSSFPQRFDLVLASDVPFDFVDASKLVDTFSLLLARTSSSRVLLVQDTDRQRSNVHQKGVRDSAALAARHPSLRCVTSEEQQIDGSKVVLHVYAWAGAEKESPGRSAESV